MNDLAVGGVMSGLDTNAIVESLVANARKPVIRYQNAYDLKALEKQMYQEVYDSLGVVKTDLIKLKLEGTYNTRKVISRQNSVITATATSKSAPGIYEVQVDSLSENAKASIDVDIAANANLGDVFSDLESGTVSINGKSIYINKDEDTLNDIINKINDSYAGVKAVYDAENKKLTLESDGADKITVGSENDSSNFFEVLSITENKNEKTQIGEAGKEAKVIVDGKEYTRNTNEISDIIEGVTLKLKSTGKKPVEVEVANDNSSTINAIATFIKDYNSLVEKLSTKDLTDKEKEFLKPLDETKRKTMTDKEIDEYKENWANLNKNQFKKTSSEILQLKSDLRQAINSPIKVQGSSISSFAQLGIDFEKSTDFKKDSYLLIDSTDLDEIKAALESNSDLINKLEESPSEIYNFFVGVPDNESDGLADKLTNSIDKYASTGGTIFNKVKSGGALDLQLKDISRQLSDAEKRVDQEMNRLWKQYSNMEETIGDLQSQGTNINNILASQIGQNAAK